MGVKGKRGWLQWRFNLLHNIAEIMRFCNNLTVWMKFRIPSRLMEAHIKKCLQLCRLSFLYLQGIMVFSEKADNLKLLPNYSHEHPARWVKWKHRRVQLLVCMLVASLEPCSRSYWPIQSDSRKARLKPKCKRNVIAVVCGYTVDLDCALM